MYAHVRGLSGFATWFRTCTRVRWVTPVISEFLLG